VVAVVVHLLFRKRQVEMVEEVQVMLTQITMQLQAHPIQVAVEVVVGYIRQHKVRMVALEL
jgi:hypothetical protein